MNLEGPARRRSYYGTIRICLVSITKTEIPKLGQPFSAMSLNPQPTKWDAGIWQAGREIESTP